MKITLEDVSALPETLQPLVAEADGKHELDLTKVMPTEDLTGLKSALQKERGAAAAYSKFGTPEELQARLDDLQEQAKKGGKVGEDAQAKIDQLTEQHSAQLSEAQQRLTRLMQRTAGAELRSELAKAGFIPEAIDDIAASAMARIQFTDDGLPQVMTTDGKPMIGSGSDHGATLGDLAKELASQKPYAVRDAGKSGGGKQPGSNGGTPHKKSWSEMSSEDKTALYRSNPEDYARLKAAG